MAIIRFSEQYANVLQKVVKALPKTPVLIFKEDGLTRLTYSKNGILFHIAATQDDFSYDGEQVGVASIAEFYDYSKAIGYPKTGEIEVTRAISMAGHTYDYIKFTGNRKRLLCRMVDLAFFTEDATDIPCTSEENPLKFVGKLNLTKDMIKALFDDRKLAPGCDNVTITCQPESIMLTMRGTVGQQVDTSYGYPNVVLNQEVVAEAYANSVLRMFPFDMFKIMGAMGLDYTMELRFAPGANGGLMAVACYSTLPGSNGNTISVYVGAEESEAATIANIDMVR